MSAHRSSTSAPSRRRPGGCVLAASPNARRLLRVIRDRASAAVAGALIALAATSLLVSGCGQEPRRPARGTSADAFKALAVQSDRIARENGFSGAMLFAEHGRVFFSRAYGLADRKRGIPNTVETRFGIGSLNKMFTGVAILQLVEAGKIKLTATLATYLPDYPNRAVAGKVTIHQLLTNTSGLPDVFYGGLLSDVLAHRNQLRTLADYVKRYGKLGLKSKPGSWAYSNYGFILLGVVIEKVTGQSYYDYVQKHVYAPAGMTRTGSLPNDQAVPDRAIGYTEAPSPTATVPTTSRSEPTASWVPNTHWLPYRGTPAGLGYSTVGDLARFARALLSHRLLDRAATELLITGKVSTRRTADAVDNPDVSLGPGIRYAYGFEDARNASGDGWVGHGGGYEGMMGDFRIYPKSGDVAVTLTNMFTPTP